MLMDAGERRDEQGYVPRGWCRSSCSARSRAAPGRQPAAAARGAGPWQTSPARTTSSRQQQASSHNLASQALFVLLAGDGDSKVVCSTRRRLWQVWDGERRRGGLLYRRVPALFCPPRPLDVVSGFVM
jgi:hypothetical protein